MGRLALTTKIGRTDQGVNFIDGTYLKTADLNMFTDESGVSIHGFLKYLKQLKLEPSEIAMDLLVIASSIYAADTRIERKKYGEDSWTRIMDLFIPVSDPDLWSQQKNLLEKIFCFLTGDIWTINFRNRTNMPIISPRGKRRSYGMSYETDTVCLFSGGLDSFIGSIDLLEQGIRPLLVGHAKSADVSPYQLKCGSALSITYGNRAPKRIYAFLNITKKNLFDSLDNSERGRSFLFLTLGVICASCLGNQSHLVIPENGMISLNIPLTPLRVGSHSTRTTHPYYLQMMQQLLTGLGLNVQLRNPYQFKTKGEMLAECRNQNLVKHTETMSCSHPAAGRYGGGIGSASRHCGTCVPCIIRQAAFHHADLTDPMPYGIDIHATTLNIRKSKGADVLAFKFMTEKLRRYPSYLPAAIRNTGPLGSDVQPYIEVYHRAIIEVDDFLNDVVLV